MSHTQGPFYFCPAEVTARGCIGKQVVGSVRGFDIIAKGDTASFEAEGNAALFAAAPDLLESLRDMVAHFDTPEHAHRPEIRYAKAAIAKTEARWPCSA